MADAKNLPLNPLIWPCGDENMGGHTSRVAVIPACIVKTAPLLIAKADVVKSEDLATAKGAFVFKDVSQKPTIVEATDKTVSYNAESQGEDGGKSFAITAAYFFPGSLTKTSAHARQVANTPSYVVIEDFNGDQILIGQPGMLASIAPSYAGGQARTDRKGTTFNVTADSIVPYAKLETPIDFDALLDESDDDSGTGE